MSYRETSGEPIKDDSWVMRDLWDTKVAQGKRTCYKAKETNFSWNKEVDGKSYLGTGTQERS